MGDVEKFNSGLSLDKYDRWQVPMPVMEVMARRVFANLRPVGEPPCAGNPKSGDPAFDKMLEAITAGTSLGDVIL